MKKVFFIATLAAMTLMACNNNNNTETDDSVAILVEEHECAAPVAFDSTVTYTLTGFDGIDFDCEGRCTISFNGETDQFQGVSFVNNFFGNFKATPCGKMMFDQVGMTKMLGDEKSDKLEQQFHAALNNVNRYELTEEGINLMQDEKVLLSFSANK